MTAAYVTYKRMEDDEGESAELAARNQLIVEQLPQVHFIALRILERLPQHVELEDLVHAGVLGLLEASKSFDCTKNAQFKTFAKFRIRGAILDSLRELDWGSRGLRRKAREIAEATAHLEAVLAREPSKEEIAAELTMTLAELEETLTQLDGLHLVGQQSGSAEGEDLHDRVESAPSPWDSPFELYCKVEDKARLAAAIAGLSEREQLILSLYYHEELTMKEVASIVGVALSRVSQIHFAALAKLRQALTPSVALPAEAPAPPRSPPAPATHPAPLPAPSNAHPNAHSNSNARLGATR